MSGRSSNNGGGGVVGVQSIPAGSRKMVQNLKEIVSCSEIEIYAMLKECNMDPNEAVNKLLSQDTFHEVKSKREKKKENKDATESRSRGANSNASRGGRSGADQYAGRGGSTPLTSTDSGALFGKPAHKRENGANPYMGSASSAYVAGNDNRRSPASSDSVITENRVPNLGSVDDISSFSQHSPAYQSAWLGVPGQVSMADIVKMGKTHGKTSSTLNSSHQSVSSSHVQSPTSTAQSGSLVSKVSERNPEPKITLDQHLSPDDEWPLVELPPAVSRPPIFDPPSESKLHSDPSVLPVDGINRHPQSQADEIQAAENGAVEDFSVNHVGSASMSSITMEENFGGASLFDNDLYKNVGSYHSHNHAFQHQEVEDVGVPVSSVTANMQQLSVQGEDEEAAHEEDGPSVVIPSHLLQTADCSHLSFGSFGSGISTNFSGPFASSGPSKNNLEEAPTDADASSVEHCDARNQEYYMDESLRTASDGNLVHRTGASAESYDSPTASRPEVLKVENSEGTDGNQYNFPSSTPGYSFENAQQLDTAFNHSQTTSQMQNLAPFSGVMQAYTNSLPSALLAMSVHPGRDTDLSYSPFPLTQSMPTKHRNTASSIGGSTISLPEALKTAGYSSAQVTAQSLSGPSVATGPSLPQHIAMHPYSQPTLPLGPFANMIGYPFLPQSYTYMPSTFQQAFGGNSIYHQSLAATLPQFKNTVSVSSLPQSASIASGYGAFGSSATVAGNFPMNPPTVPLSTTIGYDDALSSQYKDSNHLISLHQNDNSAMWLHAPGSRTMSAVPASTYYSFQGQNQQPGGFRQGQQPSQNYGSPGYPNFYHSLSGISIDHQQQNPRDGSLTGPQSQPKQSQQIWHNSY